MAKLHSALATTELHNPKGIGVESATEELLTMSASIGAVSASASIVPHTTDVFSLGTDSLRWTNVIASGNVSSSLVSTGSFGRLELAGNADIDGTLTIAGGTTTLGDSASDTVVITADLASNLIPDADGTRDIGSSAASWRNIHLDGTGSFKNTIIENREYFSDAGGEYISGDGTDMTLNSGADINLTATADVNIPSGVGVTFGNDGEKIEGDGTDLTIASSAKINLTAVSDVHIPNNVGIVFGGDSEKIEGDGTDLTIAGADINLTAVGDVNIPSGVGITFGDDAEKIEGDGTDLTITGNKINLSPTADVHIPKNKGIVFDDNASEKIESNDTDLTINSGADINLTATTDVNIPANVGITFGDDGEKIEGDGTDLTIAANILKITSAMTSGSSVSTGSFAHAYFKNNVGINELAPGEALEVIGNVSGSGTGSFHHSLTRQRAYLFDAGGEFLSGDGTDLTINAGADINLTATTDINIPASVGLTFGDDAEKIEGDGTDLTITGNKINLNPTADVQIPQNKGLTFDANGSEKIESNDTDLTINSGADINLTATADVNIPANVGITFGDDAEKIEGDGTDLTISANILKINSALVSGSSTSTGSFANVFVANRLSFNDHSGNSTGEFLESDGTDLNINVGGSGDINIPADIGLTFGDDGEKIEGDGTDLTIAGNNINLTAVADVKVPVNVGVMFGTHEKIESDDTDLNISVGANGDINIPADIGLTFGDDGEKIEGDGTDLTISGAKINLAAGSDVHIPKNKGIVFDDNGSEKIESNDTDLTLNSGADINLTATADVNIPANVGITFGDDGEKIEGDGTDLTISANKIKINSALVSGSSTSTGSFANVFVANRLSFNDHSGNATGEYLESDGTDLSINVGGSGDINIPANIGLTFGADGEKIEGDGTDLTIAGAKINLTAESDVHIPQNIGLVFDANGSEKIESDDTDLTIGSGAKINLNATSDVHIPNDVGIVFGGASEKIEGDGTDLVISANNLTVDAAADIILDAGGNDTVIKSGGTTIASFKNASSDFVIVTDVDDKDILLKGQDGTSEITALQLDMSAAGLANFNNDVVAFFSSDERLKDNIIKIGDPLMKLSELRGVEFDWNDNKEAYAGEHSYGVIAQEVEKVLPEIVTERSDGYKAVKYELIVPLLIESIKELHKKVEHIEKNCECLKK